jgi:hypothetical protein
MTKQARSPGAEFQVIFARWIEWASFASLVLTAQRWYRQAWRSCSLHRELSSLR